MKVIKIPLSMCFNKTFFVTKSVSGLINDSTEVSLAFYSPEPFKKDQESGITSRKCVVYQDLLFVFPKQNESIQ